MTKTTDYGRRDFLYALLGAGATALTNQFSQLEAIAGESERKNTTTKSPQDISSQIARIILQNIDKINNAYRSNVIMSPMFYHGISADYDLAISAVRNTSKSTDADKSKEYKGLEVVVLMWQADLLKNKVRVNIITEGTIDIYGLPKIQAKRKLGEAYIGDNLFQALENYERVDKILQKAGDKLPKEVGVGILGDWGIVASPQLVYDRMSKTIAELLQHSDKKYHSALEKKKRRVDHQLERLKRTSFKVSG